MSEQDTAVIQTAEEFAREMDEKAAEREYRLRWRTQTDASAVALSRIWGTVLVVFLALVLSLAGYAIYCHTRTDALKHAPSHNVTVWCFADPNNGGRSTSQFSGSRQDVEGICPDSHAMP